MGGGHMIHVQHKYEAGERDPRVIPYLEKRSTRIPFQDIYLRYTEPTKLVKARLNALNQTYPDAKPIDRRVTKLNLGDETASEILEAECDDVTGAIDGDSKAEEEA